MTSPRDAGSSRGNTLRLIAAFKILKAMLLVAAGVSAIALADHAIAERVESWLWSIALRSGEQVILRLLGKLSSTEPKHLRELGVGAFVYAVLFTTEGVGLWLRKRWAEYLTILATGSLVPFEIYELARRFTPTRIAALVINLAVVAYLIWHVWRERRRGG